MRIDVFKPIDNLSGKGLSLPSQNQLVLPKEILLICFGEKGNRANLISKLVWGEPGYGHMVCCHQPGQRKSLRFNKSRAILNFPD